MPVQDVIRIFSARACAEPLYEAAKAYEAQTGVRIAVDVCARHCVKAEAEEATPHLEDFLVEISEYGVHDLAIGGAEFLLDDGEVKGIVRRGQRRTIAYRTTALVVPRGNPAGIRSINDLARPGVRIAISMMDCLKGVWEDVTARLGLLERIRPNITFRASGCVAIVEAVAEQKVDVAFGWSAFKHLDDARIEIIELPVAQQIMRGTGIGLLSFSKNPERAAAFMDYLTTPEARAHYLKRGWVLPRAVEA